MRTLSDMSAVAAVVAVLMSVSTMLLGCGGGGGSSAGTPDYSGIRIVSDLAHSVCSDATNRLVTKEQDLILHQVLDIEVKCKKDHHGDEPKEKQCEDDRIAGVQRARDSTTRDYIEHCVEHVKEDVKEDPPTLKEIHPAVHKFEEEHENEIREEFETKVKSEVAKEEAGMSSLEVLCISEVSTRLEQDGNLVHEHLEEIEEGCNSSKIVPCEEDASKGLILAKGKVMKEFVEHCIALKTWRLHAVHKVIDHFGEKHAEEVQQALAHEVNKVLSKFGLNAAEEVDDLELPSKFEGVESLGNTTNHRGYREWGDLIESVCSDATHKDMAKAGDVVHDHLEEIAEGCNNHSDELTMKRCEDEQVAGIQRAQRNVTLFFIHHCVEHVKDDVKDNVTVQLVHDAADKFEDSHDTEIEDELHEQMHEEMEKRQTGPITTAETLCLDEISKDVESDNETVHEAFNEIANICTKRYAESDVARGQCEEEMVKSVIKVKGKVMQAFVDHCLQPESWRLRMVHYSITQFGRVHKAEIQKLLHLKIHEAMHELDLDSATEAFSIFKKQVDVETSFDNKLAPSRVVYGASGLAATLAIVGAVSFFRRSLVANYAQEILEEHDELLNNIA